MTADELDVIDGPPFKTFTDAIKIFALFAVVRIVMLDMNVKIFDIPGLDPALSQLITWIKSFFR